MASSAPSSSGEPVLSTLVVDRVTTLVASSSSAYASWVDGFDWKAAPASSFAVPCVAVALYLAVIYSLQYYVRVHRRGVPFPVQTAFAYHNLLLSVLSLVMFVGGASELVHRWLVEEKADPTFAFCETTGASRHTTPNARGSFYFWSYVYYLSKYYELLDTVFLAAKGRLTGWGGLNVYHHSLVLFMAWQWLEYCQSLQHIGLLFNTFVHVVMYYYFYRAGLGHQPRWKKYVTALQIVQFATSFLCFLPNLYLHFLSGAAGCKGQTALMFNSLFNATLLLEFVSIFKQKPSAGRKASRTKGEIEGMANGRTVKEVAAEEDQQQQASITTKAASSNGGSGMATRRKTTTAAVGQSS